MGNNKYYTPEIEDFHVGFTYEAKTLKGTYENKICDAYGVYEIQEALKYDSTVVRVKFLDRDDIEELGWNVYDSDLFKYNEKYFLEFDHNDNCISIATSKDFDLDCCFSGRVKNKSELKMIMKMLKIS